MSAELAGAQPPLVPVVQALGRAAERVAADDDAAGARAADEAVAAEEAATREADARLAEGFVAGDPACLEEVYRRWSPLVHTLAHRELRRTVDAEDITQQVFVSAWRSRADYAPERGSLPGWLVGITRHRLLDHHRRQERQQLLSSTLEGEAAAAAPVPGSSTTDHELDRLVLAAEIAQLPHPRGTIITMAFWEGYTYQQVAEGLDLPLGTVKSHVRRTLLHLRDRLKEARTWPT